jgi:zinc protease
MELLNINYTKYNIENGLEIILHPVKSAPLVAVNLWYKVGSANEVMGKTGLAHLFEHMMFQGSENVAKEMHFRYIQEAGGTLNGSTSFDRTNYYEKLPANSLELALWLESDRMGFFLNALTEDKLNNQKDVVYNERLERYDNQPYGLAWELIVKNLYTENHPYSWPTIGFPGDIKSYSLTDVTNFFQEYYTPNNATLTIAGDFEIEEAKKLVQKYFGDLGNKTGTNKRLIPEDFLLDSTKQFTHYDQVQLERIYFAWPTCKIFDKDDSPLEILSDVLTGSKGSRLHKILVIEKELVQDISAFQFSGKYGGHFMMAATLKPGIKTEEVQKIIFSEIENISLNGISENELTRSKNSISSHFVFGLQNLDSLADQMNHYNFYLNEPNSFSFDLNRYLNVSIDSIKNVCKKYLNNPYLELLITPKNQ